MHFEGALSQKCSLATAIAEITAAGAIYNRLEAERYDIGAPGTANNEAITGETCRNEQCGVDIRGVKGPTDGLRFHDVRHHAITELS